MKKKKKSLKIKWKCYHGSKWDQVLWCGIGLLKAGDEQSWIRASCVQRDQSGVRWWRVWTPCILISPFSFPSAGFSYPFIRKWTSRLVSKDGVCVRYALLWRELRMCLCPMAKEPSDPARAELLMPVGLQGPRYPACVYPCGTNCCWVVRLPAKQKSIVWDEADVLSSLADLRHYFCITTPASFCYFFSDH